MNFVNNWLREITLAAGALECPLDLPNGIYRLVLADGVGAAATRIEVISADVYEGIAGLQRGLEGTDDQDWPAGTVIHSTLTAGLLLDMFASLQALETASADLDARVTALEPVNRVYLRVTFTGWYPGAYPAISAMAAYAGGELAHQFDLALFTQAEGQGGASVSFSGDRVVIGGSDAETNIDTGVGFGDGWDELRITIVDSYEFGANLDVLRDFGPDGYFSGDAYVTNGEGGIDIVLALPV